MDTYLVARFLHILFAAIWFAQMIYAGHMATRIAHRRHALDRGDIADLRKLSIVGAVAGLLTIAAGFWLISMTGDWDNQPVSIGIGAFLAVVLFMIGTFPVGIGWKRLVRATGHETSSVEHVAIARRTLVWARISQAIWVIILATMVLRHL